MAEPTRRKWRAALIGCGRIGSAMADDPLLEGDVFTHAEAYARCPATELVAVCDADRVTAARCAERWGVARGFDDPAELVEATRPEIVSICTPDATHEAVARALLERPGTIRAILCEKPLATSLDGAAELVALARERGIVLAVAYMRRYAANIAALRRFIAEGGIGTIRGIAGWYGKGVLHNGSHWFDLLRMLVGELEWVEALDVLQEGGPDPTLDLLLGMGGGALATLRASCADDYALFEMDLIGERGRVRVVDSGHAIEWSQAQASPRYSGYVELVQQPRDFGHRRDQMLNSVADLAHSIEHGHAPACTGEDGLAALRIGTAAILSAREGRRVALKDMSRPAASR